MNKLGIFSFFLFFCSFAQAANLQINDSRERLEINVITIGRQVQDMQLYINLSHTYHQSCLISESLAKQKGYTLAEIQLIVMSPNANVHVWCSGVENLRAKDFLIVTQMKR